jgi:hypothetical protein
MHLIAFVVALFVVAQFLAGGPAQAQAQAKDWMEYAYPDRSFTVHFPAEPRIEPTSYKGSEGRAFEARVYSVTLEGRVFKLTVVELPEAGTDDAHVSHAVKSLTDGTQIKLDIPHRIRQTYGRQLAVARTDGSFTYLAVFVHKQRLYQLEGTASVAGGEADVDAMIFHQSLDLT